MRGLFRQPNFNKSLSAMTKGKWTRELKKAFLPWYGKRGAGIANPRKYLYNKLYYRTSFGIPFLSSDKRLIPKCYRRKSPITRTKVNIKSNVNHYKICPKCGAKSPIYYNFCESCGHKFQ